MAGRSTESLGVMKIAALRIEINGKQVAVAGAEGLALLTGHVGIGAGSSGKLDAGVIVFNVIGLATAANQPRQLTWADGVRLVPGDRVTFEVVETDTPTPPSNTRDSPSPEQLAAAAKKDHA